MNENRTLRVAIANRRTSGKSLARDFPGWAIIDVTSRGPMPWRKLSPFYPHGGIPVPMSAGWTSQSVEGIWQGLKVFEHTDVDTGRFDIVSMKGIKRSIRTNGKCLGHRAGVFGDQLLGYVDARLQIYLPSYHWMLAHRVTAEIEALLEQKRTRGLVLLDYATNPDPHDPTMPLSHAAVLGAFLERPRRAAT